MTLQEMQAQVAEALQQAYEREDKKLFLSLDLATGDMKIAGSYIGLITAPSPSRNDRHREEKYEAKQPKHYERQRTDKK